MKQDFSLLKVLTSLCGGPSTMLLLPFVLVYNLHILRQLNTTMKVELSSSFLSFLFTLSFYSLSYESLHVLYLLDHLTRVTETKRAVSWTTL